MRAITSRMKRCVSLLLAVLLMVPAMSFSAFAATTESTTVGTLVAKNYDLSDAEKDLLKSGYLAKDSTYEYSVPNTDNVSELIEINTNEKTITICMFKAQSGNEFDSWVPTQYEIIDKNGVPQETVSINGAGTYNYTYVGNAFSVKVTYELSTTVEEEVQNSLLGAAAILKQGVANTDTVAAQAGNLFILESAMPELVNLSNTGVQTSFTTVTLSEECKAAIAALNDQMTANGGTLNLSKMITEYDAGSKTGYLMTKGTEMQNEVAFLVDKVSVISDALNTIYDNIEWLIEGGYVDATLANQIKTLAGVCGNLADGLNTVNADPWTAANSGTDLVKAEADYATLDTLVAALGESTAVTVKNPLSVETTAVTANVAMWNVTVKVVLNKVDNNNAVSVYGYSDVVLTLADGATKDEIQTEINNSGIVAAAIAAWGDAYVDGQYEATIPELPETLTADLIHVITYNPKEYTITIAGETAEYPYGKKVTLPVHEDPAKSYDYKDANGKYYAQGTDIIVESDMTFTREEGKSYTNGQLLAIIADNYGTDKVTSILTSGALKVDETVSYREPSKAELEELVQLSGNTLTVQSYASSYEGLSWTPYSYVVDGTENLFNGADEVTITGDFETVQVFYRLTLTNHTKTDVGEILGLVKTLVEEANGQKSVMDKLAGYEGQMGQLTKNMLNGLNGVIGGYSSENGGGLNADPTTNDELVAYFQTTIADIVKNCTDSTGYLKLYNIILAYNDVNNGGLAYYYQNDEAVRNEITVLSGYLNDMLDNGDRQAALEKLMTENGYGDKVATLTTLKEKLAEISAELKPVNSAIDTTDPAKLSALAKALVSEGSVAVTEYDSPYIEMGPVTRTADKYVTVEVKAVAAGKNTVATKTILKGTALTQAQVNEMKTAINDFIAATIDADLYNNDYANGADLDALVGVALTSGQSYTYYWTPKVYTVTIEGDTQDVTVNDLTIDLPEHPAAAFGMSYEYTINGQTVSSGIYTFTTDEVKALFAGGNYTITRVEKNAKIEKLVKMVNTVNSDLGFEALTLVAENGVYTGITANVSAGDMMDLMMSLILKSGYSYIGLNNEGFIYSNDKAELEMSIQTLINAILNDDNFNNNTIIALGEAGKGKLLTASMQLGDSAADLDHSNLTFVLNLSSVPAQLTNNVGYLKTASNYITFQSNNGVMDVEVNLPDQVYGAYVAALLATGNIEKTNVNELKQKVALQFLFDYVDSVAKSDMDLETFTNTLTKLGQSKDLTQYNNYYNKGISIYNNEEYVEIQISDNGAAIDIAAPGATTIDALFKFIGIDKSQFGTYLNMLKEYKADGKIEASAVATLGNLDNTYYALIADVQADGVTNKFEAPSGYDKLSKELASLAGYSAVILLDNVDGDLTISGTTVLDLNGKTVDGSITSTGTLYIVDSSMDTANAGTVTGAVSGNVVIFGGNYTTAVSGFLKTGYEQVGTNVQNVLYTITSDANGNVTFDVNTDVMDEDISSYTTFAKAVAVDIAVDMILNYYTSAALTADGNDLYHVELDDLVGLLASNTKVDDLIQKALNSIEVPGMSDFINVVLADLLDFAAIETAAAGDGVFATYTLKTSPWNLTIDKHADNYATVGITSNDQNSKTFTVSLKLSGSKVSFIEELAGELAVIVDPSTAITVDLEQPTYVGNSNTLSVVGSMTANAKVDLTKKAEYITILTVILANGNPDNKADLIAALNAGNMVALKDAFDELTVEDVFTSLKALSRSVSFATIAASAGVTVDVTEAAELESIYHLIFCGAGKVLEELEITGYASKMGALDDDNNGTYELVKNPHRTPSRTVRGYTVNADLTVNGSLIVDIFDICNHSFTNYVYQNDATCDEDGTEIAACDNGCGETDTRKAVGTKLGHAWGNVTYTWATDYSTATATRVCGTDANHVETETVNTTSAPYSATCTEAGGTEYTATFTNPAFAEQKIKIPSGSAVGCVDNDNDGLCDFCGNPMPANTYTVTLKEGGGHTYIVNGQPYTKYTGDVPADSTFTFTVVERNNWSVTAVTCKYDDDTMENWPWILATKESEHSFTVKDNAVVTVTSIPSGGGGGGGYTCSCHCKDANCRCRSTCHALKYTDLKAILESDPNIWYHERGYVDYVICKGLMIGISETEFAPSMLMSRAMIVTALYRLEGTPTVSGNTSDFYTDVADGDWYSDAIVWATNEGLVDGYGNNLFGPSDVLTREQLATLFYRYAEFEGKDTEYSTDLDLTDTYTDADTISWWAQTGMEWAYDKGLITGPGGGLLAPRGDINRSEFAALLCHWIWGEFNI